MNIEKIEEKRAENRIEVLGAKNIVSKKARGYMKQPRAKSERMKTFYPKSEAGKRAIAERIAKLKAMVIEKDAPRV